MAGGLSLLVLLMLISCMLVEGQTSCSLSGIRSLGSCSPLLGRLDSHVASHTAFGVILNLCTGTIDFMHTAAQLILSINSAPQFHFFTVTVSAESVGNSTPGVRVTWNTTTPPECVISVRVEFRNKSYGPVVASSTTTNTSQTVVIQTGLQCATYYYITVVVTGETSYGLHPTLTSRQVQVVVGGKEIV